jgi:cell division protein DivIC
MNKIVSFKPFIFVEMKLPKYLKNKYAIAIGIFTIYTLFLDDVDIFAIVRQNMKLSTLEKEKRDVLNQLTETRETLKKLETIGGLERYAREKKLFKKDDEDIFVISYE